MSVQRIPKAELGLLVERARALLGDPGQGEFEPGVEPVAPKTTLIDPADEPGQFAVQARRRRASAPPWPRCG